MRVSAYTHQDAGRGKESVAAGRRGWDLLASAEGRGGVGLITEPAATRGGVGNGDSFAVWWDYAEMRWGLFEWHGTLACSERLYHIRKGRWRQRQFG